MEVTGSSRSHAPEPGETASVAITVQLHLGLERFRPTVELGRPVPMLVPPGSTVGDVVTRACGLPERLRLLVTVNGHTSGPGREVEEGDRVRLFMPLSGG